MVKFIFWGEFNELLVSAPNSSHFVRDLQTAREAIQSTNGEVILFIRDAVFIENARIFENIGRDSRTRVIIVYGDLNNVSIAQLLIKYPINHFLPVASENSRNFLNYIATLAPKAPPEWTQNKLLTNRRERALTHSRECEEVYAEMAKYARELGCFPGFEGVLLTSASELLTNAFYNGKRDPKTGAPLVTDRQVKFALDPGETITITYGRDGKYLWLAVSDPFGSLDRPTLAKALHRAAIEKSPKLNTPGGAGLGLFMLFDWSTEFNFFLQANRSTTVACKFLLTNRNRIFESEPSAIHIFESA